MTKQFQLFILIASIKLLCVYPSLLWANNAAQTQVKDLPNPAVISNHASNKKTYLLEWEQKDLSLNISMFVGELSLHKRLGESGIVTKATKLPKLFDIKNGAINLVSEDSAIIVLYLENKSKNTVKFSVSPHSTSPPESAIELQYACLCNGHKYSIGAGETWYRIMRLKTSAVIENNTPVSLKHLIYRVK